MKYLLLLGIAFAIWWSLAQRRNARRPVDVRPEQDMAACEFCGTYVPESEALKDGAGRSFCSASHRDGYARKER